jgi:mRNA interferase MazF
VICAPVYTVYDGLATQLVIGLDEGLKHESSIHCDALMSLPKSLLTHYIGSLSPEKIDELNQALAIALDLPE